MYFRKVSIKVRTLNSDFTCPICLGILRDTMTVMECLHRFCRECIELSIRMGQKQCPACRTRVPSRRNLRKDEYFDSLIAKIYPDLDKVSEEEENEINQLISEHNTGAYIESVEQGCRTQDSTRRTRVEFTGGGNSRHGSNRKGKSFRGRHVAKPKDMRIGFRMQPNEDAKYPLPRLQTKYLRCLRSATISQMQSYLNIKFERKGPFEISLRKNRRIICQDHQTLDEIAKMAEGYTVITLHS
eukprot:jgi/Bigna1/52194/estExt_Genewise1Plus.C_60119